MEKFHLVLYSKRSIIGVGVAYQATLILGAVGTVRLVAVTESASR